MKSLLICAFLFIAFAALGQRRSVKIDSSWYIGTWELRKIADEHGTLTNLKFRPETIHFTKDSIFVKVDSGLYRGVWKVNGEKFSMDISGTNQFDYYWIGRTENEIWFQRKGVKLQKYFVRTSKE
jgi:hypothetical protein